VPKPSSIAHARLPLVESLKGQHGGLSFGPFSSRDECIKENHSAEERENGV